MHEQEGSTGGALMRRNGVVVVVAILVVSSLIVGLPRPDAEDVSDAEEVQDDLTARAEGIFNPLCPLCPKFPPDLQKAEGQDGSVKLTWYSNLDYPLTEYYKIYYCTDENDEWKKAASVSADPLVHVYEFTHYGVHNGVTYYYLVKAANYVLCPMCAIVPMFLEHESPSSKIKSAVPSGPPSEPLNVAATYYEDYRGAPHIIVNWSYPEDDGGSRVFGFNVYRGESHGSEVFYGYTDCLAFADIGIEEFGVYYYQIAAVNCISEGPKSSEVGISVPEFPPEPPTIAELFPVGFDGPSRAAGEVEITASFKNIGADVLMNLGFRVGLFLSRSQWEADILDLGPSLIPLYYHTQYNVWQDMTFTIGPVTVSIPEAAYGDYYYAIIVDTGNTVVELNEGNNSRVFGKVTISPPGCDIVANLVEGPLVYTCLEPLKIRRSFSHEGPIGLVTISYAVMASVDNIITRDDYRIAYSEYTEITLGAGECDDSYIVLRICLRALTTMA
jgi:hypothetical protein